MEALMTPFSRAWRAVSIAAALLAVLPLSSAAQDAKPKPEVFIATAANTSPDIAAPPLFELEINVDRYTTTAEQELLAAAFNKGGQERLLNAVQKMPRVGRFRSPGTLAYDLKAAFTFRGRDNRRRIILITDRYVSFSEANARPRSMDYPFSIIELRVDDSGLGEGEIIVVGALGFRGNEIMIEEFLNQPLRLTKVRQKK
jgi:hypothetical protein